MNAHGDGRRRIRTIHLVYPHGAGISTPDAIGRNLGRRLEREYDVVHHEWDAKYSIDPDPTAALVGHPHPARGTVFRRSARHHGWGRVLMLSPYVSDPAQVAFVDDVIADCDLYLAITGPYWFATLDRSAFSHWAPKMVRLDLAIDRSDYPPLRQRSNPPGRRRFVYIGHGARYKNTDYLDAIAARSKGVEIAWIGSTSSRGALVAGLGWQDLSTSAGQQLVAGFDFLITVGRADANPTTILEAMSWGLIPVATPQSGYADVPGIINVPLDDPAAAAAVIQILEGLPEEELGRIRESNWRALEEHYNWERFASQVIAAIESDASPDLRREPWALRARLRVEAFRSPYGPVRRRAAPVARALRRRLRAAAAVYLGSL